MNKEFLLAVANSLKFYPYKTIHDFFTSQTLILLALDRV
jgi:hypothetical protein